MENAKRILIPAPVFANWLVWHPEATSPYFRTGVSPARLNYEGKWFENACHFTFEPDVSRCHTATEAKTLIYLLWDGVCTESYVSEFIGLQRESKYTGWRVNCTCAFFDANTKRIIDAFVFYGEAPPSRNYVTAQSRYQVLGKLPKVSFSAEDVGSNLYSICPEGQVRRRLFTKGWLLNTCVKCNAVVPHARPWPERLVKRMFPRLRLDSDRCLLCGLTRMA